MKQMKKTFAGLVLLCVLFMFAVPVMAKDITEKKELKDPVQSVEHSVAGKNTKASTKVLNDLKKLNSYNSLNEDTQMVGYSSASYYLTEVSPRDNDVIEQGDRLYIKFYARDTYKYYYTKPLVSIFNSNSEIVYSKLDLAKVSVYGRDTYSGYISWDTSDIALGEYYVYIVNAPCNSSGTLASNWTTFNTPYIKTKIKVEHQHQKVIDAEIPATCTQPGKTEGSHCRICGAVIEEQYKIPATGHEEVTDEEVDATCTQPGKTTGSHCSVCGSTIGEQKVIPATGHSYYAWETVKTATACAKGKKQRTCMMCGKEESQSIPKLKATIKLSSTKKTVKKNKSYTLKITKLAKGDMVKSVKSSKKSVATVKKLKTNQYKITGKKKGTATVTVVLKSGKKATCKITVKNK